jgi:ornithine cyclodeaminase/alanine dehydrogenase-like protein (mu-crystallin family)
MNSITDNFIKKNISYLELRNALKLAFRESTIQCPPKLAYEYKNGIGREENTLLFMPAWDNKKYLGVKLITATPHNSTMDIPYLNGLYVLFDAENGMPLATMDAKLITNMRTAATSVLATTFLAKENASSVLVLGNGSLSPYYISAYASMAGIKKIYLWGRNLAKSQKVVDTLNLTHSAEIKAVATYKDLISSVDIISCITSSYEPLVNIEDISKGQHFDLAGAYTENMQEVSTDVVVSSSVFTDNFDVTLEHAGELVKAFSEGKLSKNDIKGDFKYLCKDNVTKRLALDEITLFKCTGMALEDLVFASLVYEKHIAQSK